MLSGSYRVGRALRDRALVCVLALVLLGTTQTLAQLTAADIAALQQRGQEEGWTFTVAENAVTARPLEELCGLVVPPNWQEEARYGSLNITRDLPARFDWRDYDGVTPVRSQGSCGSCWAFATIGPLESAILINDGVSVDLSEQWLVSCNSEGWGCGGGWWAHDYHMWKTDPCGGTGAVLESSFPYRASNADCDCPYEHAYLIDDWAFVPGGDIPSAAAIKQAIYDYGPVCVAICVNSAFQSYDGGVFDSNGTDINHGVTLVGWDDNQGSEGVWFLKNSWGPSWGEGGYMRIEYGANSVGYAATYVIYASDRPDLLFEYPDGKPEMLAPGVPTTFRVNVQADTGTPVPGTGWLEYSTNGGESFFIASMRSLGQNEYEATLPAQDCYTHVDWYISAEEQSAGRITDPDRAPISTYSSVVATGTSVLIEDDFETDQGWTLGNGASTGNWERADPEQVVSGSTVTQPEDDHSPDGTLCYVTGAAAGGSAGAFDVDGGPAKLTAPTLLLEGADAIVSYWRWFHISTQWDDSLRVRISNDGGVSWVTVEQIESREEWTYAEWRVSDYVTPTDQVRVRFVVNDTDPGSLMEALVDDFKVEMIECLPPDDCPEDLNGDRVIGLADLSQLLANYGLTSGAEHSDGDIDGDADVDITDLSTLLAAYGTTCD